MRILSWNVNGLRAVQKRGFINWLKNTKASIVCLQEIKVDSSILSDELRNINGYNAYFSHATKKGYSGIAVYSKVKPITVSTTLGVKRFDSEGRMLQLEYPKFILINLYIPHGGRQKENLEYKLQVYKKLFAHIKAIKTTKPIILIGDFNIAHKEIDLARPKNNKDNIMFTPTERSQIDKILDLGFIDTFRQLNKGTDNYTWFPYMANARERNLGWRIDYIFVPNKINKKLKKAFISDKTKLIGSDHCPVGIEFVI